MSFVAWVVLGLAAGFIGGRLANRSGKSIMLDVLLGIVGAVTGGWLFYAFGPPGVNGFHLESHFAAVFGSLGFLAYVLRPQTSLIRFTGAHSSTACHHNSSRRRALDRVERSQAVDPGKSQKD
jgi:uncharacterized membrane protein YeaQ/YmgE (transglycosylase-associated protein family)